MNQMCDVTFQVADLQAAVEWYRCNFDANIAYAGKFEALLQVEDVGLALVLRDDRRQT